MMAQPLNKYIDLLKVVIDGYECEEANALLNETQETLPGVTSYSFDESAKDRMVEICKKLGKIRYEWNLEEEEEIVVGFDDEFETLLVQLTGITSAKELQIISIAGMGGIGKTTLARKLYNDKVIKHMFDIRGWVCVSKVNLKRDLLLDILSSFIDDLTFETYKMNDEQLGAMLYKLLSDRKYLVVFDDILDCKTWNDLKMYFPVGESGSRVIFTSRVVDMSVHVQSARPAHVLRLRTEDESWNIFRKKVFRTGICPRQLEKHGKMIITKCEGLPLEIIKATGLVKDNLSVTWWEEIAASHRSFMFSDPSEYMDSLTLTYNHLPLHLRPCFLFFGSFPKDYEVPVTELIWLWIAQGFIHESGNRTLEDVAEDFLMELIRRSFLMTSKKNDDGQIKACRIRHLWWELCIRKAKEENFDIPSYRYTRAPASSSTITNMLHRVFNEKGGSLIDETYKSIRILDMESVSISPFPSDVIQLANLRYLAIEAHDGSPHSSLSNLVDLQTLIISSTTNIVLPKTIRNMVNLRHVYITSGENLIEEPKTVHVKEKNDCPIVLKSLQTLSQVSPRCCKNICSRAPSLRKLGFYGELISWRGDLEFPRIGDLSTLQKLKLLNTCPYLVATKACNPIMFPEKLKKLTLSKTSINWEEMWTFAWLPNLEVLKLKSHACFGKKWETGDAEFARLKVLQLHDLDISQWVCSRDNFPKLQRLVVHRCLKLDSIPPALGNILTLEVIDLDECRLSTYKSALVIQELKEFEGKSFLKVHTRNNWHYKAH